MRAKPGEKGFEPMTILLTDRDESQAEAVTALYVANYGLGLDTAFLDQEIELGGHALFDT